ncbi:MAG: TadE/TadG family type IV pilus assembly protein [Candidatus Dormibacterales bacterium]
MTRGSARERGQALVELAVCLPVLLALALGCSALARLADARAGLDAATAEAAAVAARAPDPESALALANSRFAAVVARYPLSGAEVGLDLGGFGRGVQVHATGRAEVDLSWALPPIPDHLWIGATAAALVQPWRSR